MATTPRRSDRGVIFTPDAPQTRGPAVATTYHWLSAPSYPAGPSSGSAAAENAVPHYTAYKRLVDRSTLVKRKKNARAGFEESRFAVGDGVLVNVQGGNDGVGILVRLWEEEEEDSDDDDDDDEEDSGSESEAEAEGGAQKTMGEKKMKSKTMMGEVHWCFRRSDLPSMMRDLSVAENEVLLAASPIRRVSTSIPISLLVRTVPIYSRSFFRKQFEPKGRSHVGVHASHGAVVPPVRQRQGVYWCDRAFDKGAKGGKVWRIDVDGWREGGKGGEGWMVPTVPWEGDSSEEEGSDSEYDEAGGKLEEVEQESEEDEESDLELEGDEEVDDEGNPIKKRKATKARGASSKRARVDVKPVIRKSIGTGAVSTARKPRRKAHPSAPATFMPSSIPALESLPADPYERALRLLHVGATPESLPCREEEFVDVLGKVEEGVDSGGGGCLYIAGVPGTGKTATVHAVVKELKRKAEDGELPPFSYVEINGLKIPSPQHAYTVLWEAISGSAGVSAKTALRGLEAHFGRKTGGARGPRGHTFVVLMDELDQLLTAKQDVVYNFFNWPTMRDSQMFVIAVANRMDLPQHLAAKIKSRLGLQTLLFQPYDRQNLIEIVQSRLVAHPHSKEDHKVLLPDAIALAATKMAGTNGDARRVLDACRRAVEVTMEKSETTSVPRKAVSAKEMMAVLNQMSSSPVAMFVKSCSEQQKMMLAAVVRCVRREGVPEITWRSVRSDHDNLTRSLLESSALLSPSELLLVLTSLLASHALTTITDPRIGADERRVALGMEIGEVGRVLMGEGESWRRALAGT